MTLSRAVAPLALVALLAAVAGCGTADGPRPQAIVDAAQRTISHGSARISIDQRMAYRGGVTMSGRGDGVVDTAHRRARLDMTLRAPDDRTGSTMRQDVVVDGVTLFRRAAWLTPVLPGGRSWLKVDLALIDRLASLDLESLLQGAGRDATQALRYLLMVSGPVDRMGVERVRGVPTTRYRVAVDFRSFLLATPAQQRLALRRALAKFGDVGREPVDCGSTATVSCGGSTFELGGRDGWMEMAQRIELWQLGAPVRIVAPAARETQDALRQFGLARR